MNTHRTIFSAIVALVLLALSQPVAQAHTARELITTIGPFEKIKGVAVDLETGNVYVADAATQKIDIYGFNGGAPADDVPSQIIGVELNKGFADGIAVDNSCYEHQPRLTGKACNEYDPSYGDVYVGQAATPIQGVRKFGLQAGAYREVAFLRPEFGNGGHGVTGDIVDAHGNLYTVGFASSLVVEFKKVVNQTTNGGSEELIEETQEIAFPQKTVRGSELEYIAADSANDIYLGSGGEKSLSEGALGVGMVTTDGDGGVFGEKIFTGNIEGDERPVGVDSVTGNVLVGDGPEIAEYDSAGELQLVFGSREAVGGSLGTKEKGAEAIAVNGPAERVYVANPAKDDVDVFGGVVGPPVFGEVQPGIEGVSRTSAVIAGSVTPESSTADYYFEYVEAGQYQADSPEPYREGGRTAVTALTSGHSLWTVSRIVLSGLRPSTTYHYRMVASNASATVYGPDETFTTSAATPPVATTGGAVEVSATAATLTGVVDPRGLETSYVFEVGTDTGYTGAKLFGSAGASTGEVLASVGLLYLVPGTTYHYRLVASSFDGTSYGEDGSFTTPGVPTGVAQPVGVPLVSSPSVQFPSLAGAISVSKTQGKNSRHRPARRSASKPRRRNGAGGTHKHGGTRRPGG